VSGRFKGNHLYCRVGDIDAYVDLVRRLQTPYYEEARARFGEEDVANWLSDANEHYRLFGVERGVLVMLPASPFW